MKFKLAFSLFAIIVIASSAPVALNPFASGRLQESSLTLGYSNIRLLRLS